MLMLCSPVRISAVAVFTCHVGFLLDVARSSNDDFL
jgi:hypothetical protein